MLLLLGVISRYVFGKPIVWSDEVVSISFVWLTMLGSAIAVYRNEHLRLNLFVEMLPPRPREFVHAFALVAVAAVLVALVGPAIDYTRDEWSIHTPALDMPNAFRVRLDRLRPRRMLAMIVLSTRDAPCASPTWCWRVALVAAIGGVCWGLSPQLMKLGTPNIAIFLVGFVAVCLVAGVPIAFCFGIGAVCYLAFSTHTPLTVVIGRMDEGMSSLVLVSVPIFVLLGCVLDATGMGKAIVDFLASLLGHIKAGMSYVLLGSLFIVSGISGSKVSDMATVAPALFPEMKRRGHKPGEMVALLATGAAMADTVPPSIVLIVLGAVAGVSIAGLFQAGFVVAMVLLAALVVLARWKARHEDMQRRPARPDEGGRPPDPGRRAGPGAPLPDPHRGGRGRGHGHRGLHRRRRLCAVRRPGAVRRHRLGQVLPHAGRDGRAVRAPCCSCWAPPRRWPGRSRKAAWCSSCRCS